MVGITRSKVIVCWVVVLFWVLLICLLFGCVGFVDGLGAGVRDYIYMLCWVLGWGIINIGLLSTNLYIYSLRLLTIYQDHPLMPS